MKAMKIFREFEQQQLVHTNKMKLIEIFKNLHSMELKVYSEAAKEFIKLLKEDHNGDLLREYIILSPKFSELLESWRLQENKPGLASIISVFTAIFEHPAGKVQSSGFSRIIYHLAYSIFKEKTDDIYTELISNEYKRQNAALLLLASIAKRGIGIASQVAESFLEEGSHKITTLAKLAGTTKYNSKEVKKCQTRHAFIKFAMSFVEVGNSKLLIKILQHKDLYSGVFRNICDDDPECIEYVLSTLKDKVLTADSQVPPWLRSFLFGSIALEQLSYISGNPLMGSVSELAHKVLVMVCTDPSNGLMPGINLKGNEKRLFDFMKKLEAADCAFHKELLLEIARTRISFCAAYMNEFPYNLQIHSFSLLHDNPQLALSWFSAISLAADMISTVNFNSLITSTSPYSSDELLSIILKCIIPRQLSKSIINNGLQHADERVNHGTLRIVLEALKSLAGLLVSIDNMLDNILCKKDHIVVEEVTSVDPLLIPENCFFNDEIKRYTSKSEMQKWVSIKESIQDEVRVMLPDPQVLLKLLSSSGMKNTTHVSASLKRCANSLSKVGSKKQKTVNTNEDIITNLGGSDIEVANVSQDLEDVNATQEFDEEKDDIAIIAEIWGLNQQRIVSDGDHSKDNLFQSKLFDTLKFYLRTVPLAIEGSFDFFKILPQDPSAMSTEQIQSLLSLLLEYIHQAPSRKISAKPPKFMYKHLQRLINIYVSSNMKGYQEDAYTLVRAAMISTGAFDQNLSEIDAWLFTLTGHCMNICSTDNMEENTFQETTSIVSSFLCDSVSTVGNNLYKYIAQVQDLISDAKNINGDCPGFSPLVICTLEKCLRLLGSESKTYKLFDKSMISFCTCNAISLILQTQVEARPLSGIIFLILEEKLNEHFIKGENSIISLCEWRPMMNLLYFAKLVFCQDNCNFSPYSESIIKQGDDTLYPVLVQIQELLKTEDNVKLVGVATAFMSSIISAKPNDILRNLPQLLTIMETYLKSYLPFLSWVLFLEHGFLANVADLWSDMFSSALSVMDGVISNSKIDHQYSPETVYSTAFQSFLNNTPFRALFTSLMAVENLETISRQTLAVLHSKEMVNLLQFKLSQGTPDDLFVSLRILLFWANPTVSNCRTHASDFTKERFRICITLLKYLLEHISVASGVITHYVQDIIDLIFKHPVIILSLSAPFYFTELRDNTHDLTSLENFRLSNHDEFQLLSIVVDFAINVGKQCPKLILNSLQKYIDDFVENIKLSIMERNEELVPKLYLLTKLMQFTSPFVLLNLVELLFDQLENSTTESITSLPKAVSIGLCILDSALSILISYLQHQNLGFKTNFLWAERARNVDTSILMKFYLKILDSKSFLESEHADACLLKLITIVYGQKFVNVHPSLVPLCTQMSRMIAISPMKTLLHCIYPTSRTKGKLLLRLTEISSIHMKLFGKIFMGILSNNFCSFYPMNKDCFSEQDYLLLLPTALSYLIFNVNKYGEKHARPLRKIAKFYSSMLLDCFSNWKDFISQENFLYEDTESFSEDYQKHCSNTLLGKAVAMFSYSLTLIGFQKKQKQLLGVFDSFCSDYTFFDQHGSQFDFCSCTYKESLDFVNSIVAKISFTKSLMITLIRSELERDEQSRAFESANKFMCILVNTHAHITTELSLQIESATCYPVFKFFEHYILSNIVQLCLDIQSPLKESLPIPILNKFFSSCLQHRLMDPFTLRAVRCILVTLSESISSAEIFTLLVKHPEFGPLISKCCIDIDSSTFMRPYSSILSSLDLSTVSKNGQEIKSTQFSFSDIKLELIKLLRVLYQFKGLQQYTGSPELLSLLMCGYSATMSEIDMEIFQLMNEIEAIEGFNIADMDFVWGGSALKVKNGLAVDEISSINMDVDTELIIEKRKILFRENIPVVPLLSVKTVLHFCNDRASLYDLISIKRLLEDNKFVDRSENQFSLHVSASPQPYDPVYIMRFSNHCLTVGYFEPTEFSKLGLLAVAFASISSPDEETRKLGYTCLEKFKNHLDTKISMNYEKKKDALQLQLLLTYIQNGITEQWQRIPYVIAVFAAEASLVLLDQSNNHFSIISKLLKNSSRMNIKTIPLFPELLQTSSLKTDHLWILKLLYAGLNSDIDADIYKKQEVPKLLLSFCSSSLCDHELKLLILQIVKKCVRYPLLALSTVKKHGLISWLSSTLFVNTKRPLGDHDEFSLKLMELTMKVIYDGISSPSISDWLQVDAFEQLSSLSSHLHKLAASPSGLFKGNGSIVNSLLSIILSTMKASHYRKSNQSHFTVSLLGLCQLYRAIDVEFSGLNIDSISTIGLDIILMSTPTPAATPMDSGNLAELLTRAIPAVLKSFHMQRTMTNDSNFLLKFNRRQEDNVYISKLLRWVSASVILGSINSKDSKLYKTSLTNGSKMVTLRSTLEVILDTECENVENYCNSSEALAINILYLQQLLGSDHSCLPSVILALHLLLMHKQGCTKFDEISVGLAVNYSKIRCPPEISPDWRWSYDEPWSLKEEEDVQIRSKEEQMEEEQACQSSLLMFCNILGGEYSSSSVLSCNELESSGLFEWERNTFLETNKRTQKKKSTFD